MVSEFPCADDSGLNSEKIEDLRRNCDISRRILH